MLSGSADVISREGYTFDNWYEAQKNTEGNWVATNVPLSSMNTPTKFTYNPITFIAQWTANPSTVTFELNAPVEEDGSTLSEFASVLIGPSSSYTATTDAAMADGRTEPRPNQLNVGPYEFQG